MEGMGKLGWVMMIEGMERKASEQYEEMKDKDQPEVARKRARGRKQGE